MKSLLNLQIEMMLREVQTLAHQVELMKEELKVQKRFNQLIVQGLEALNNDISRLEDSIENVQS